jgi:5-methylcytosine-specific restriction endonuclease McrA
VRTEVQQKPRYRRENPSKKQRRKAIEKAISVATLRREARRLLYATLRLKHAGIVPCFVCGEHVEVKDATLEHVMPLSKGGKDTMSNYAISHSQCNNEKGDMIPAHVALDNDAVSSDHPRRLGVTGGKA